MGVGKCSLHFSETNPGDPNANPLPCDVQDGFFNNAPPPPTPLPAFFYVDPAKISNVSMSPGTDFDVNVDITNASGVYGLEFKLGFNATLLNANSVTRGSFVPPSAALITEIDNVTGFVKFNVSLSSSLGRQRNLGTNKLPCSRLGENRASLV